MVFDRTTNKVLVLPIGTVCFAFADWHTNAIHWIFITEYIPKIIVLFLGILLNDFSYFNFGLCP